MMKRILLSSLLFISLLPVSAVAQKVGLSQIPALETFIQVHFQALDVAIVVIREYALSSSANDKRMERQTARLAKLVPDNKLLRQRFRLRKITVLQEQLKKQKDYITAEYLIGSEVKDRRKFLQTLYSALLNSDVKVSINDEDISLQFVESKRRVMQQNGRGAFQRGNEVQVIWPVESRTLELLFATTNIDKEKFRSLGPFLSESISSPAVLNEADTNDKLQHDFDIAKLQDLLVMSDYIEQYHEATGHYPLQGKSALPNYSIIATREQQRYVPAVKFPHEVTDVKTLISELQSVLGNDVSLPFDPQQVAVNKPNFYIFRIEGDIWHLSVHLFEAFPFAARLGDHNFKLEVTNSAQREAGQWLVAELLEDESFRAARDQTPHQPDYVDKLRSSMGNNKAF